MIGRGQIAQQVKMMRGKDEGFVEYIGRMERRIIYIFKKRIGLA